MPPILFLIVYVFPAVSRPSTYGLNVDILRLVSRQLRLLPHWRVVFDNCVCAWGNHNIFLVDGNLVLISEQGGDLFQGELPCVWEEDPDEDRQDKTQDDKYQIESPLDMEECGRGTLQPTTKCQL